MDDNEAVPDVADLLDADDLEFLNEMARARGISAGEMAKDGIQEVMAERTKPRPVRGVLQAFRKK